MSRRGAEEKPRWRDVPPEVKREAERILRARVVRAERVFGGYAPSATFRIRLANGKRAFFKGTYPLPAGSGVRWVLDREERLYRDLGDRIRPWAPALYGSVSREGWHALLLEDLGAANVPPWTAAKTRVAMRSFAEFHEATIGDALPRWLPRARRWGPWARGWSDLEREPRGLDNLMSLARQRRRAARRWLDQALPPLRDASLQVLRASRPFVLVHGDTRSDNVRLHGTLLRIFDWPAAAVGPHEFDVAQFALDPALEGGPSCERSIVWYREVMPLRDGLLDASVAAIAGFFAYRAWRPPVAGLPRLRPLQRRALRVSLAWAAQRLDLSEPTWLEVPD